MRPRQSSLGISDWLDRSADHHQRFNEAEAIKPRNLFQRELANMETSLLQ